MGQTTTLERHDMKTPDQLQHAPVHTGESRGTLAHAGEPQTRETTIEERGPL